SRTRLGLPRLVLGLAAPACAAPGSIIPYTLRVTNLGSATALSGTATLTFPDGSTGSLPVDTLAPGATISGTLPYTVPTVAPKGSGESESDYIARLRGVDNTALAAQANLSWQDAQGNPYGSVDQSLTTTELLPILAVGVDGPDAAQAGDTI